MKNFWHIFYPTNRWGNGSDLNNKWIAKNYLVFYSGNNLNYDTGNRSKSFTRLNIICYTCNLRKLMFTENYFGNCAQQENIASSQTANANFTGYTGVYTFSSSSVTQFLHLLRNKSSWFWSWLQNVQGRLVMVNLDQVLPQFLPSSPTSTS